MFAVDRQNGNSLFGGEPHDNMSGGDQCLLVCECDLFSAFNGGDCGSYADHAHDGPECLCVRVQQFILRVVGAEVQTEGHAALDNAPCEICNRDLDDRPVACKGLELRDEADLLALLVIDLDDFLCGNAGDNKERNCHK